MNNALRLTAHEEQKLAALEAGFSGVEEAEDLLAVLAHSESCTCLQVVNEAVPYARRPRTPSDNKSTNPLTEDQQAPQGRAVVHLDACPLAFHAKAENAASSLAQAKEQSIVSASAFPVAQDGQVQGIDHDELASNGQDFVSHDGQDGYLLRLTHREILILHSVLSRDRGHTRKMIRKGVCVDQDLRSSSSVWGKLQYAYFAGFVRRPA